MKRTQHMQAYPEIEEWYTEALQQGIAMPVSARTVWVNWVVEMRRAVIEQFQAAIAPATAAQQAAAKQYVAQGYNCM